MNLWKLSLDVSNYFWIIWRNQGTKALATWQRPHLFLPHCNIPRRLCAAWLSWRRSRQAIIPTVIGHLWQIQLWDHQHACQTWSYHPSQTSFHISLICLNSHIIDVSPLLFPLQLEMRYQINQPLVNTIFHKALTCLTFFTCLVGGLLKSGKILWKDPQ